MFVHMTVIYIPAERVKQSAQAVAGGLVGNHGLNPTGLCIEYLLESLDAPGKLIWLSFWETRENAQAFLNSPDYAGWIGPLQPYLLSGPEWHSYRSLENDLKTEQLKSGNDLLGQEERGS